MSVAPAKLEVFRPLKAIRKHCMECCGYTFKAVKYCTCTACTLWPYRLGRRPQSCDPQLMDPDAMPSDETYLEMLP